MGAITLFFLLLCLPSYAQGVHSVTLSWTQSACPSCTITGNNVYRSSTTGGPYTQIKISSTPIVTYIDGSLPQLTTYYYVVTATCAACTGSKESGYSNEVKATTLADPTTPAVPTGVTAVSN